MPRVAAQFTDPIEGANGAVYRARVCCRASGHTWEAWLEFVPHVGGRALRTGRETTQPNFQDIVHWAGGLTKVHLQGALRRAETTPPAVAPAVSGEEPAYAGPRQAILDPFSVFAKGESVLRDELSAFSRRHLVAIVEEYALTPEDGPALALHDHQGLIELIVAGVKKRTRRAA
jgi:hypothetical protein